MPRWEDVRPILVTAYGLMEQSDMAMTSGPEIARAVLGRPDDDPRLGTTLRALHDDGYLNCTFGGVHLPLQVEGTAAGRQEVQGWPGSRSSTASAELLVDLLRTQADAADTPPEQKSRLRAILNAIGSGSLDALSKVTAELILRGGGQIT